MTKQELKDSVADVIKTNGENEITGANLQEKLFEMIDQIYNDKLFPNGIEFVRDSRYFLPSDEGKLLIVLSDNLVQLTIPNEVIWEGGCSIGINGIDGTENVSWQTEFGGTYIKGLGQINSGQGSGEHTSENILFTTFSDVGNGTSLLSPISTSIINDGGVSKTMLRYLNDKYNTLSTYISANSDNWNTSYEWGNHASAGYAGIMVDGGSTNTITFTTSKYFGTLSSPMTGSLINYDLTNAVAGSVAIVFHNNSFVEPTYGVGTYKKFGSYVLGSLNILTFTFVNSSTILLEISSAATAGYQPEIPIWLSKGGVATGFILNKLNQFLIDISSIRNKIIRLNPIVSETFAGVFVPLICGTDNTTVIGNPLDTNFNFISSNYQLLGTNGGLAAGFTKYIDTSIVPNSVADFGLNNCSIGVYGLISDMVLQGDNTINIGGSGGLHRLNNTTSDFVNSIGTRSLCTLSRTSSTGYSVYINGVKTFVTRASTTKSTSTLKYGYPSTHNYSNPLVGGYYIAKGLNDAEELIIRTAWSNLMTGLIRNV